MSAFPPLEDRAIQVWSVDLRVSAAVHARLESLLSGDERERAGRFRFDAHRRRFIVARGVLRTLLGAAVGRPAEAVRFRYGTAGKPTLADPPDSPLGFNVSHADDVALLALGQSVRVGVDVERVRTAPDLERLAARFLAPSEAAAFLRLPPPRRTLAFYTCWCRKEAFLKARGTGLAGNLKSFAVTLDPDEPPRITQIDGDRDLPARWTLTDLDAPGGYVAALAADRVGWQIQQHRWSPPRPA